MCMKPYRATVAERNEIKRIVREWKDNDLVTETRSAYASPVILVKKKDGDSRLVLDYRQLNKQTVIQSFPMPQIDEQLEQLSGCTLFSVLDLAHGYLKVPLRSLNQRTFMYYVDSWDSQASSEDSCTSTRFERRHIHN